MKSMIRGGVALVVCAPSGAGKTTLIKKLLHEFPDFCFSISCTTRAPRSSEQDGRDYHFISQEEFLQKRDENFFAEWAEVHGYYYGTPLAATEALLKSGKDVLFDIDVQGAAQIRKTVPNAKSIFVFPPSMQVLEDRLRSRMTESEADLQKRLAAARLELQQAIHFDYWIINDDLERAWNNLRSAYRAAALSPSSYTEFYSSLLHE